MYLRLHLLYLLDLRSSPTVLPSLLSHPVETGRAHYKVHSAFALLPEYSDRSILYGGPGENRTPVQDAFTLKGLQQFFVKGLTKTQQQLLLFQ